MAAYVCLIVGKMRLQHDEGTIFDLGVAAVQYTLGGNPDVAATKALKAFQAETPFSGSTSQIELEVTDKSKVPIWKAAAQSFYLTWQQAAPNHDQLRDEAIANIKQRCRYLK